MAIVTVDQSSVGMVCLTATGSPAKFEAALCRDSPHMVGFLMTWAYDDWLSLFAEVANAFGKLNGAAARQEVQVISISLGALGRDRRLASAIAEAYAKGVIIYAAAGQVFRSVIYPGALDTVITVGGTTTDNDGDFYPWRMAA